MKQIQHGSPITFHNNVNIEPLGSHCSLCGKKTTASNWFPLGWGGEVDVKNANSNDIYSDAIWGWFPLGSDCAKRFAPGVVVQR
jgi:hypothetical protein